MPNERRDYSQIPMPARFFYPQASNKLRFYQGLRIEKAFLLEFDPLIGYNNSITWMGGDEKMSILTRISAQSRDFLLHLFLIQYEYKVTSH